MSIFNTLAQKPSLTLESARTRRTAFNLQYLEYPLGNRQATRCLVEPAGERVRMPNPCIRVCPESHLRHIWLSLRRQA